MKKELGIKTKLLAATLGLLILISAVLTVSFFTSMSASNEATLDHDARLASEVSSEMLHAVGMRMSAYADPYARRENIGALVANGDAAALEAAMVAEFQALHTLDATLKTLEVTDTKGIVVMRGHNPKKKGDDKSKVPMIVKALSGEANGGLTVSITTGEMAQDAVVPLKYKGAVVGTLKVGSYLRADTAVYLKEVTKRDILFIVDGKLNASTLKDLTEFPLPAAEADKVADGKAAYFVASIGDARYNVGVTPLRNETGKVAAAVVTLVSRADLEAQQHTLVRNALLILVVMLTIGVGLTLVLTNAITRPLGGEPHEVIAALGKIATGDLTTEVQVKPNDTTSLMATAKHMRDDLRSMMIDTRQSADAIDAAAQSMSAAGAQVEKSSGAQSAAAAAVAAAVEQTSVSISETAGNAHMVDETATRARNDIETTLAAVRETADNVAQLAGMIDDASGDIGRLAESSRQIDGIVRTIKDIADQTNLLALNAAIEAARAGDQGRGFAVVADEVRKLAENTTKATSEISGLIGGIQSQVDGAVARMTEANTKAGTTRERVVSSTGALDAASANTARVTTSVRSIADAVREQDVAVQQIAGSIEQIAQMTEENTAAAGSAAESARYLADLAGKLRASIERFKV